MPPDYLRFLPWVFAILVPLALYRRFRRTFGRQPLRPKRMMVRIAIFLLLAALLTRSSRDFALGEIGGVLIGAVLALWGASRTRFATENGQRYYVPHTYTGIAVSLLFVARLIYRLAQSSGALATAGSAGNTAPAAGPLAAMQSPLTAGIFFVLIGYYVCYYSWVLWKSRHITAADLEVSPAVANSARDGKQNRENQETGPHEQHVVAPTGDQIEH
jgi:cytochrome b561